VTTMPLIYDVPPRTAGGAILGILGALGCLLLAVYFALMALVNYAPREHSPGMGSFGVVMCLLSLWGAWKSVRHVKKYD
jgi:hypothetical protein